MIATENFERVARELLLVSNEIMDAERTARASMTSLAWVTSKERANLDARWVENRARLDANKTAWQDAISKNHYLG